MARGPKIELLQGNDGKWYFHRRNANGRITKPSQGYTLRRTARRAAMRDNPGVPLVG